MKVTMTAAITHRCPFADDIDIGLVTIEHQPDPDDRDDVIELWGLRAFLASFHDAKITHEEVTTAIAEQYPGAHVTTRWRTADIDLVCVADAVPRIVTP